MKVNGSTVVVPFPSARGNGFLLPFNEGYIAVDACTVETARRMVAYVLRQDQHPSAIRLASATHTHAEHIGGLAELQRLTKCEIHLHHQARRIAERAAGRQRSRLRSMRQKVHMLVAPWSGLKPSRDGDTERGSRGVWNFQVHHWLQHGSTLPGGWTVLYTPGHTHDSICFHHSKGKVLIAGDTLAFQEDEQLELNPDDTEEEVMDLTVRALYDLPVQAIYPGHGEPRFGSTVLRHALHKPPQSSIQRRIQSLLTPS